MKQDDHKITIPWTFIFVFLAFSLFVISGGFLYYKSQKNRILNEQYNELEAIASLRIRQINDWRREKTGDGEVIQHNILLIRKISEYLTTRQPGIEKDLTQLLQTYIDNFDYQSIALVDNKNNIRLSMPSSDTIIGDIPKSFFSGIIESSRVLMTDMHTSGNVPNPHLDLLVPLMINEKMPKTFVGIIVFRINPEKMLFPLIQSWPTPSKSSESLIFRIDGDSLIYLHELRFRKNTTLKLKFPLSIKSLPAAIAASGREGLFEGRDYRNVPVISCLKKIPGSPWFMVTKVDRDEIFIPLSRQMTLISIITALLILTAGSVIGYIWRNQRTSYYRKQLESENKRFNAELRLREQFFVQKGLIESLSIPIYSVDTQYRYTSFNNSHASVMKQIYGVNIETGMSMLDYQTISEDREKAKQSFDRALKGEQITEETYSGDDLLSRKYFDISNNPILNDNEDVIGVAVIIRDLTASKKMEEQLTVKMRELERFNKIMVGRENRMIDLKQEINDLCSELDLPLRYNTPEDVKNINIK